ncbi:N-terminal Xaa-Pro-Lys N-methyltransferase 1-B-like [Oscarella lobularis]|uniref:N-terminal Xaa-Pro-Lys N-methyltransferase 1-B-like n=1 Tax=Oscarella lobularis TaxID=121494 RepID=UPI0033132A82
MAEAFTPPTTSNESDPEGDTKKWYGKAEAYWKREPATVNGMLGGFGRISSVDVKGSKKFLEPLIRGSSAVVEPSIALGILVVGLLLVFPTRLVQTVDPDFEPEMARYSVIWCQWVLLYLTDGLISDDLVAFLQRCKAALTKNGIIVIKENVSSSSEKMYDDNDSSVCRPSEVFLSIFKESGLRIIKEDMQMDFPEGLYPVKMWALN